MRIVMGCGVAVLVVVGLWLLVRGGPGEASPEGARPAAREHAPATGTAPRATPSGGPQRPSATSAAVAGPSSQPAPAAGAAARQAPAGAAPTTVEEAIASNPALAADLDCRDPTARFSMDYNLRMFAKVRSCLAGKTHSKGRLVFMMFFDNDPATRKAIGTGIEPRNSELSPEDDAIVLECLRAYQVGSETTSSEKFGQGPKLYRGETITLPIDDSAVYQQVRAGTYTPGTPGCDYP